MAPASSSSSTSRERTPPSTTPSATRSTARLPCCRRSRAGHPPEQTAMEDADRRRFVDNLQAELDGAALYRALARIETGSELAAVYTRMAEAEERHAGIWRAKLREAGMTTVPTQPGWRTRALIALARRFGPGFILPTMTQRERADSERYRGQPEAREARMAADERSHARLFQAIGEQTTGLSGGSVARLEGRHRSGGGNALRAAVLGANDGLVSNASLVMGVAGAELAGQ